MTYSILKDNNLSSENNIIALHGFDIQHECSHAPVL